MAWVRAASEARLLLGCLQVSSADASSLLAGRLRHWIAGALSSALTDICTFPFDTIKKGMQAVGGSSSSNARNGLIGEIQRLHTEGGLGRFYTGCESDRRDGTASAQTTPLLSRSHRLVCVACRVNVDAARLLMISTNGALFNATFVAIKETLGTRWPGGGPLDV